MNLDHVVPKSMQRKFRETKGYDLPKRLAATVGSCFECNNRKGTRKLVPPSWGNRIAALKEYIPGEWRTWDGDVRAAAFSEVHL